MECHVSAPLPIPARACLLLCLLVAGPAAAGLSGRVDVLMQADNREFNGQGRLEGQGDVVYANARYGLRSGLSLALRRREGVDEAHLYRLFVEKRLVLRRFPERSLQLSLGRLQRADGLGFYTLDGAILQAQDGRVRVETYAGRPGRMEDYRGLTARALYGADVHYRIPARPWPWQGTARLGWQRIVDERHEDRINWGWQSLAAGGSRASLFQGTYLPAQRRLANLQARIQADITEQYLTRLDFETYRPDGASLSFRDRFYSHYALGGQQTLSGELHYRARRDLAGYLQLRQVWREAGQGGHGIGLHADGRLRRGQSWQAWIDRLVLGDDSSSGLYVQGSGALSSRRRITLSGAIQFQQRRPGGLERVLGLEARLQQALHADLHASCFASLVVNGRRQNEYRAGVRIAYFFDDRRRLPSVEGLR